MSSIVPPNVSCLFEVIVPIITFDIIDAEYLESFAKANHGSMDLLLMQMAIQFGYKIALENVQDELK